jgi:hypothetical protein
MAKIEFAKRDPLTEALGAGSEGFGTLIRVSTQPHTMTFLRKITGRFTLTEQCIWESPRRRIARRRPSKITGWVSCSPGRSGTRRLATYTAEVEVRSHGSAARFKFAVGEVWAKRGDEWKCRYYHATILK